MVYDRYAFAVPQEKQVRLITDTDAKNEADDQFAVVQALLSPKMDNVGLIAAHFGIDRVPDAMEASYRELETILDKMYLPKDGLLYHGAPHALPDRTAPVVSEGAELIVREAMKDDPRRLFVIFLGPLTDLASAYLMEPRIAQRITVIWIGGGVYPEGGYEFNTINDLNAANVIMDSPMELWQVPMSVYRTMKTSFAELYEKVRPYGKLGEHLFDYMVEFNHKFTPYLSEVEQWKPAGISEAAFRAIYPGGENWQLGDSPVVGLMLTDHEGDYTVEGAPRFEPETCRYLLRPGNPRKIRVYHQVDTHFILEDFFAKIKYYFGA